MNKIKKTLVGIPQVKITLTPTPFHHLDNISKINGCNLYIKRDDLTGFALGGNKTRKFDFLVADALKQGCDTIIGIGANQSNFCRVLSGIGSKFGFEIHLILSGRKPQNPTGNLRIDHILGAHVHHIDTTDSEERMNYALKINQQLKEEGKKVYFLPPGGSTPLGTLGYAQGFAEIMEDALKYNLKIDKIIHASSSAGTQAGLVLGQAISGWKGEIHGISVDTPQVELAKNVYDLATEAGKMCNIKIDKNNIFTDDSYVGKGYGIRTKACEEAVNLFARKEGIFLDYVYTGKGAAGMLDYCQKGKIKSDENVIFLHTGGNIQLFE